jgi:hypothetical protein
MTMTNICSEVLLHLDLAVCFQSMYCIFVVFEDGASVMGIVIYTRMIEYPNQKNRARDGVER